MDSFIVLIINALLYSSVFVWYARKKILSIGLTIWGLYTFSSWMSVLFFLQPGFKGCMHDNPQHIEAVLYLFIVLYIFISPLFSITKMNADTKERIPKEKMLMILVSVLSIVQILLVFVDFSKITETLSMNNDQLLDARTNVYYESNSLTAKNPFLAMLSTLETAIHPLAAGLSIYLLLCYKKHRRLIKLFFLAVVFSTLKTVVVSVSRGEMISNAIYFAVVLVYLRDFISAKAKKIMMLYLLPILVLSVVFFWTISISRFGDTASFMMYKYAGEPMINFAGLLYPKGANTTNGHAYLLSWYFHEFHSGMDKWEFIEKTVKIPGNIFYTVVGGFVIELGKFWTLIVALIFNRIITKKCRFQKLSSFFVLLFFSYIYSYGVFLFKLQNQQGLFFILFTIILYYYFDSYKNPAKINYY